MLDHEDPPGFVHVDVTLNPERTVLGFVFPSDMRQDLRPLVGKDVEVAEVRTDPVVGPVDVKNAAKLGDPAAIGRAARGLIQSGASVIGFGCMSAEFVLGPEHGDKIRAAIAEATGCDLRRVFTANQALVATIEDLVPPDGDGRRTIGLASPYGAKVTAKVLPFLDSRGLEVVRDIPYAGLTENISRVDEASATRLIAEAYDASAQAIIVACTNFPTYLDAFAELAREFGLPILTVNDAMARFARHLAGVKQLDRHRPEAFGPAGTDHTQ